MTKQVRPTNSQILHLPLNSKLLSQEQLYLPHCDMLPVPAHLQQPEHRLE